MVLVRLVSFQSRPKTGRRSTPRTDHRTSTPKASIAMGHQALAVDLSRNPYWRARMGLSAPTGLDAMPVEDLPHAGGSEPNAHRGQPPMDPAVRRVSRAWGWSSLGKHTSCGSRRAVWTNTPSLQGSRNRPPISLRAKSHRVKTGQLGQEHVGQPGQRHSFFAATDACSLSVGSDASSGPPGELKMNLGGWSSTRPGTRSVHGHKSPSLPTPSCRLLRLSPPEPHLGSIDMITPVTAGA